MLRYLIFYFTTTTLVTCYTYMTSREPKLSKQQQLLKKFQEIQKKKNSEIEQPLQSNPFPSVLSDIPNSNWRNSYKLSKKTILGKHSHIRQKERSRSSRGAEYEVFDSLLERSDELYSRNGHIGEEEEQCASITQNVKKSMFEIGDFAPITNWDNYLIDSDGNPVSYGMLHSFKPLVIVADARPLSQDMKELLFELNINFPKESAQLVAITCNKPSMNRKLTKKSSFFFPVLSDCDKMWMDSYFVTKCSPWEKMMFIIEPQFGKFLAVHKKVESYDVINFINKALSL